MRGLGQQDVGPGVDGPATCVRLVREVGVRVMPSGVRTLSAQLVEPRPSGLRRRRARRAARTRIGVVEQVAARWRSGRRRRRRASSGRCVPGVRSHHGAGVSLAIRRCARAAGRSSNPGGGSGRCVPIGSSSSTTPASTSRRTQTATSVLVIDPIRYCVSVGGAPSTRPAAPDHTGPARRATAATTDGTRPSCCADARQNCSARAVSALIES